MSAPMRLSTLLIRAQERIRDPKRWCQNKLVSGDACCALGALAEVAGHPGSAHDLEAGSVGRTAWDLLEDVAVDDFDDDYCLSNHVAGINDRHGHAAVMRLYDLAISRALSKEAGGGR